MVMMEQIVSDEAIELNTTELERMLFDGERIITLEVRVLQETYDKMLAVIKRNGWELESGLRILLTLGLGYLEGQYLLQSGDATADRLLDELVNLESKAAVMKYHAFDYMRDNKIMEMRMRATQAMTKNLEQTLERLRAENEALQQELERVRSENQDSAAS